MYIINSTWLVKLAVKSRQWTLARLFQCKKGFLVKISMDSSTCDSKVKYPAEHLGSYGGVSCNKFVWFFVSCVKTSSVHRSIVSEENTHVSLMLFCRNLHCEFPLNKNTIC